MELIARTVRPGVGRGHVFVVGPEGPLPGAPSADLVVVVAAVATPSWGRASSSVRAVVLEQPPAGDALPWPVPTVSGLDPALFRDGDPVIVDADLGRVELPGVERREVVTVFLQRPDGRVLLLRRSDKVGSFQGRWAGVSGFLEDPTPLAQAIREVAEETGLTIGDRPPAATAPPLFVRDGPRMYVVHPFRFAVGDVRPRLDWEHTAFAWVPPEEIAHRPTVPQLDRAWRCVAPRDRTDGAVSEIV